MQKNNKGFVLVETLLVSVFYINDINFFVYSVPYCKTKF